MQSDLLNMAPSFPFKLIVPKRSHQEGHAASQDASLGSKSSRSSSQDQLSPKSARHFLAESPHPAAAAAGPDVKATRQEASRGSSQQADRCVSRAKSCTVCAKGETVAKLWWCGSCDAFLHERCSAELPEPLCHYCLFCPDCKREPWHRGAIILASGSTGEEGATVDRLKVAVEKIRQAHVEKRALAGNPGPKTYVGLRGDVVSFLDLFRKMTSRGKNYGFQLERAPDSAGSSRSQTRWRLDIGWGQPVCQITSVDQVPKAETSAEHARSSGAATHGEHRQSSLDQHTSAAETICGQPATAATVFAAPGVAKQRSHDSQKATCKPSHSATGLLHQNGRGHIRGRPSSSQRGPVGLGSATPFKERATPSMLKRKAKAAPLDVRIGSVKKLKTCHDVIDLTSDFDTLVSAQPSQAIRTVPLQIDWHGTKTSGNKHEAVRVDAMQFDALHDDAGIDKEDTVSSQQLTELTNDRQVMQKWLMDQLQRLKQHDIRLAPVYCARLSRVVADGGSADDLIARMYSGFQQILPYQSELSEAEQVNDDVNYFRGFLELTPSFIVEG